MNNEIHSFGKRSAIDVPSVVDSSDSGDISRIRNLEQPSASRGRKRYRMSWFTIAVLYLSSIGIGIYWLHQDLTPHTWRIPPANALTYVTGTFSSLRLNIKSPYTFHSSDGKVIRFGCEPDDFSATCIADAGISLRQLADKKNVRVGYFYAYNTYLPQLSNVMMTLSVDGREIFNYEARRKQFTGWSNREEGLKRSIRSLSIDVIFSLLFLALAVAATIRKLKSTL